MSFLSKVLRLKRTPVTVEELKAALKNKEFSFHYQPEWDLKTNRVVAVEALARWQSPKRGYVPPMQFIPLMEESGLIHDFTSILFGQALADLAQLHQIQPDLSMAVNLSVCQLQEPKLIDTIQKNLMENNIDVKYLECELTESQELTEDILNDAIFKRLIQLGVAISLDDFGMGESSFARLKQLNVQKLKIDLYFIRELLKDKKNQAIVSSIIQLGHDLGFPVLAEGIETKTQQIWLKEHGCDYGQGYWFSRALPMDQLKIFLQEKVEK